MDRIYKQTDYFQGNVINPSIKSNLSVFNKAKTQRYGSVDGAVRNKILNKLPKRSLETLLNSGKMIYLDRSENIYCPDDAIRYIYFPETAVFSDFNSQADGKTIEVVMTGREGLTGVWSLINDYPAHNFTQVLQAGYALRVNSEFLVKTLNDETEVKKSIYDYLNQFINYISQKTVCNGFHLIESRLCCWLLMIQERTGGSHLTLTHEQIALSLGTCRPTITQITKELRREKMIEYIRGKISILDRHKMKAAACSCYVPIS